MMSTLICTLPPAEERLLGLSRPLVITGGVPSTSSSSAFALAVPKSSVATRASRTISIRYRPESIPRNLAIGPPVLRKKCPRRSAHLMPRPPAAPGIWTFWEEDRVPAWAPGYPANTAPFPPPRRFSPMSSKASITVLGSPEDVQRRWQDDEYRPDYI